MVATADYVPAGQNMPIELRTAKEKGPGFWYNFADQHRLGCWGFLGLLFLVVAPLADVAVLGWQSLYYHPLIAIPVFCVLLAMMAILLGKWEKKYSWLTRLAIALAILAGCTIFATIVLPILLCEWWWHSHQISKAEAEARGEPSIWPLVAVLALGLILIHSVQSGRRR